MPNAKKKRIQKKEATKKAVKKTPRKKQNRKPSVRQKKTLENIGKKMSMAQAMKKAGYSDAYANNPHELAQKDSWQALMDKHFPETRIAQKIKEVIDKRETIARNNNETGTVEIVHTDQPHSDVVRMLDIALKLRQRYDDLTIKHKFGELSDEELEGAIAGVLSEVIGLAGGKGTKAKNKSR